MYIYIYTYAQTQIHIHIYIYIYISISALSELHPFMSSGHSNGWASPSCAKVAQRIMGSACLVQLVQPDTDTALISGENNILSRFMKLVILTPKRYFQQPDELHPSGLLVVQAHIPSCQLKCCDPGPEKLRKFQVYQNLPDQDW